MIKILLVDDESEFAEYMKKRLVRRGLQVEIANDGEAALAMLDNQKFDVMVLDMLMPGMDGSEVLEQVKERDVDTEVIMLTGHGTIESAVQGVKHGAFDYLAKPCDLEDLVKIINDAYDQKLVKEQERLDQRVALALMSPRESVKTHKD